MKYVSTPDSAFIRACLLTKAFLSGVRFRDRLFRLRTVRNDVRAGVRGLCVTKAPPSLWQ
jgi:hypothetical protein